MTTITPDEQPDSTAGNDGFVWSNEDGPDRGLPAALAGALLIMAGIFGAAGLLYFREAVWAWATGDPVTFTIVLFMLTVGALLTIRAARETRDRDGVEP